MKLTRALTVACSLVASLLIVGVARGGQYQVLACSQAPTASNESWTAFVSDPTHLEVGETCPPTPGDAESTKTSGMFAADVLGSSGHAADGAVAGWRFIAPAGTEVVAVQDDRYLGAYADNGWSPFVKADGATLETCTFATLEEGCTVGDPFGPGSLNGTLPIAEASTVTVGVKCIAVGGCTTGATIHRAWAALYGAKVTLATEAPPAIEAVAGGLWDVANSRPTYHKGVESLSFVASALTGVSSARLAVDGREVGRSTGQCDYARALPCGALSGALPLDTSQLTDGVHALSLEATDAAGNVQQVSEPMAVANHPPSAPLNTAVVPSPAAGFAVSWSDPPDPIPITTALHQLCDASGSNCGAITSTSDAPFSLPAAAAGGTLRLWLGDAAGNAAAANASLASIPANFAQHPGPSVLPALARLKLRVHRTRNFLTVTVRTTSGHVGSSVHVVVEGVRGSGRHFGRRGARRRLSQGAARFSFRLGVQTLRARKLVIRATAAHAAEARKVLTLARAKAQAGIPPELLGR
jgi:hypothetical protein